MKGGTEWRRPGAHQSRPQHIVGQEQNTAKREFSIPIKNNNPKYSLTTALSLKYTSFIVITRKLLCTDPTLISRVATIAKPSLSVHIHDILDVRRRLPKSEQTILASTLIRHFKSTTFYKATQNLTEPHPSEQKYCNSVRYCPADCDRCRTRGNSARR